MGGGLLGSVPALWSAVDLARRVEQLVLLGVMGELQPLPSMIVPEYCQLFSIQHCR